MKRLMTVLVVDDLEKKRESVKRALSANVTSAELRFLEAKSYETARDCLLNNSIDFVILDIMIPAGDEEPSESWSRILLMDIVDGNYCYPMHVFGLTEHGHLVPQLQSFYDRNMFGLFVFLWDSDEWARAIASKIDYITQAVDNGASYRLNSFDYDLLILTARHDREFAPIRRRLFGNKKSVEHPLWRGDEGAYFGKIKISSKRSLRVAHICVGETGLAPTAAVASQAIQLLRPKVVCMLGMCAGFEAKGLRLLDVIVARETACWQAGKSMEASEGEKFDLRGNIRTWSGGAEDTLARSIEINSSDYEAELSQFVETSAYIKVKNKYGEIVSDSPKLKMGMLVSGSSIVASEEARSEVEARYPSAIGLEMEAFALYTSTRLAIGSKPEFFVIKGVADLADGNKHDEAQALASELSACVMLSAIPRMFEI